MTYEPLLIVGLIVIGYLVGRTQPLRYRTAHENGVRLWVEYLTYGFICFASMSAVACAGHMVMVGLWEGHFFRQGSSTACLVHFRESFSAYLDGTFIKKNILLLFGLSVLAAWGVPWLLNVTYFKRETLRLARIYKQIQKRGNQMELMLFEAIDRKCLMLFVLENNTVCLGLPFVIPDPIYDNTYIPVLVEKSGYLKEGGDIVFTTDDSNHLNEADIENMDVVKFQKILPRSKIISADMVDWDRYEHSSASDSAAASRPAV